MPGSKFGGKIPTKKPPGVCISRPPGIPGPATVPGVNADVRARILAPYHWMRRLGPMPWNPAVGEYTHNWAQYPPEVLGAYAVYTQGVPTGTFDIYVSADWGDGWGQVWHGQETGIVHGVTTDFWISGSDVDFYWHADGGAAHIWLLW